MLLSGVAWGCLSGQTCLASCDKAKQTHHKSDKPGTKEVLLCCMPYDDKRGLDAGRQICYRVGKPAIKMSQEYGLTVVQLWGPT